MMSVDQALQSRARFAVEDDRLSDLPPRAFGCRDAAIQPWASRLERHSSTWVKAFEGDRLIGLCTPSGTGSARLPLGTTIVDPDHQRLGVAQRLVKILIAEVGAAGCELAARRL